MWYPFYDSTSYIASFDHSQPVPQQHLGREIAVIGAGVAGLVVARKIMQAGMKPVIFERSGVPGGRCKTHFFPKSGAYAELGAMRFPESHKLLYSLTERFGLKRVRFPSPLVVDTMLAFGKNVLVRIGEALPSKVQDISNKHKVLIDRVLSAIRANPSYEEWDKLVQIYDNKSLLNVISEAGWEPEEIKLYGQVGIGFGGFDAFFNSAFLEILELELNDCESNQFLIVGGVSQVTDRLWDSLVDTTYWGQTSLKDLHQDGLKRGVLNLSRKDNWLVLRDAKNDVHQFQHVVLTVPISSIGYSLQIDQELIENVSASFRQIHVAPSTKIYVLTKSVFWKEPGFELFQTLTDLPVRQMYLFDKTHFGNDCEHGVICLAYVWEDDALRMSSMTDASKIDMCLNCFGQIYGEKIQQRIRDEILDFAIFDWTTEYSGAFRMARPGHAENARTLQKFAVEGRHGLFMAGEGIPCIGLSGWVEGAMYSALDTAKALISNIQQSTTGPIDQRNCSVLWRNASPQIISHI